jgi:4-amino-4-deoxy-L-arabinose transferase-like glycosyltransferase
MSPSTLDDKTQMIVEASPGAKQPLFELIAVIAASAFALTFGLGAFGFLGPAEPRYAEVAREMFATGDYISTRLCGCLWFEKPVLQYWLSAVGYHLFGVNEFAARLPSALSALLTLTLIGLVLRRAGYVRMSVAAPLVLGTSGMFIAYAHVTAQDMILTAAMTASLLSAYLWTTSSGRTRAAYWILAFLFMGFAVLAKGLVGIVLVAGIFGAYLILTGQPSLVRWRDCLIGTTVFLAVAGAWYVPVTMRHGWPFIQEFFIRHHFERYTTNEFGHPQPFYFFLLIAIAGAVPWSFFLIPAVVRLVKLKPRNAGRDSLIVLAWIWTLLPLLFFSFSGSKLPGYILPISPAMAIIIGAEIERALNGDRARALRLAEWMTALCVLSIGIGLVIFARREAVSLGGPAGPLLFLPLMIAALSLGMLGAGKRRWFIATSAAVVLSAILCTVVNLLPTLRDEVSLKPLSLEAAAALRPGEKIGFYLKKDFAAVFYSEGRVLCSTRRGETFYALHQDMLADELARESSLIVITDSHWLAGLEGDSRFEIQHIARQGEAMALRVSLKQ